MKRQDLKNLIKESITDWLKERSLTDVEEISTVKEEEKKEPTLVDEVGKFYVVEKPTKDSELSDVFFETDLFEFVLQMKGGLEKSEIHGIYKTEGKAKSQATKLLKDRDKNIKETYKKGQDKVKAIESTIDELKGQIESKMQEAVSNPEMRESLQTESDSLLEKLTTLEAQVNKLKDAIDRENVRLEKKGDKKEKLASRGYKGDDKEDSKKED